MANKDQKIKIGALVADKNLEGDVYQFLIVIEHVDLEVRAGYNDDRYRVLVHASRFSSKSVLFSTDPLSPINPFSSTCWAYKVLSE